MASVKEFMKNTPSTEDVARLLFDAVIAPLDLRNKKDEPLDITKELASQLLNRKRNVPNSIKNNASNKKIIDTVYGYFEKSVAPQLTQGLEANLLNKLTSQIKNDDSIATEIKNSLTEKATLNTLSGFLADVFLYTLKISNKIKETPSPLTQEKDTEFSELTGDVLNKVDMLLNTLPRPPVVEPVSQIEEHELSYVAALYLAYGDVLGVEICSIESLNSYPMYKQDFDEQRIDYFAAYSVERGILEFSDSSLANQFNELKDEIYTGVKSTARKTFPNGYEKLLSVLEQAVLVPVSLYVLSRSPYWINNKIKKGACHFLVIDGLLSWVNK